MVTARNPWLYNTTGGTPGHIEPADHIEDLPIFTPADLPTWLSLPDMDAINDIRESVKTLSAEVKKLRESPKHPDYEHKLIHERHSRRSDPNIRSEHIKFIRDGNWEIVYFRSVSFSYMLQLKRIRPMKTRKEKPHRLIDMEVE